MRGRRRRVLFDSADTRRVLMIRRLMCCGCGQIHHELPDCVVPYKRHSAEAIEEMIADPEEAPYETSTTRRITAWWGSVLPYFLNVLKSLAEKYSMSVHTPPAFREIIRAAVNSNSWTFTNWICTRSVCVSG